MNAKIVAERKSNGAKWGFMLGFALGGFFDGILLHQVLQWHHLLSLVPGMNDLRLQVLWDGYFHALMYVIAIAALWGLWRSRQRGGDEWGSALIGSLLLGFGVWNLVDIGLAHWIIGIHRVRLDSPSPLMWDLIWLAAFGAVPIIAAWWVIRSDAARLRNSAVAMMFLTAGAVGAGAWALQPAPQGAFTTVVFGYDAGPHEVFAALEATGGRLVWADQAMGVVVVAVAPERRSEFYRHGALLVGGTAGAFGCVSWSGVSGPA
ncbi:MAG TPA: DUF2243 domain-containing protein [Telluria sp.]|jgi:uncharacterized membrane protein